MIVLCPACYWYWESPVGTPIDHDTEGQPRAVCPDCEFGPAPQQQAGPASDPAQTAFWMKALLESALKDHPHLADQP